MTNNSELLVHSAALRNISSSSSSAYYMALHYNQSVGVTRFAAEKLGNYV